MPLNWLHTVGKSIKDFYGRTLRPIGCEWQEPVWLNHLGSDLIQRADRMKELGVSIVRVSLNAWLWRNDPTYKPFIDQIVAELGSRDIYTILNFQKDKQFGAMTDAEEIAYLENPTELINFWRDVALRYINTPSACAYEIFPAVWPASGYDMNTLQTLWHPVALQVVNEIHSINPNVLCFVPDAGPSIVRGFQTSPLPAPNVVYLIHRYYHYDLQAGLAYAVSYSTGDLETAKRQMINTFKPGFLDFSQSYPVFFIEFGATMENPNWNVQIEDLHNLLRDYGLGFTQHVWYPNPSESYGFGMIMEDFLTLNLIGEIWSKYIVPMPTSPIELLIRAALSAASGVGFILISL